MSYYHVNTSQNVDLEFQVASLGDRILAFLLDGLFITVYSILVFIALFSSNTFDNPSPWLLVFLLPYFFYHLVCEIFLNGQSFGKMIMKIRVVNMYGGELTAGSCFIRWILRLVDITLTNGIAALVAIAVNGKGQRLGDLAAGTTVLKIDSASRVEDTAYVSLPDNYSPSFPEVDRLSDSDVQTIKEVLLMVAADKEYSNGAPHPLMLKTREIVQKKLGISSTLSSRQFLITILRDYNFYHQ